MLKRYPVKQCLCPVAWFFCKFWDTELFSHQKKLCQHEHIFILTCIKSVKQSVEIVSMLKESQTSSKFYNFSKCIALRNIKIHGLSKNIFCKQALSLCIELRGTKLKIVFFDLRWHNWFVLNDGRSHLPKLKTLCSLPWKFWPPKLSENREKLTLIPHIICKVFHLCSRWKLVSLDGKMPWI